MTGTMEPSWRIWKNLVVSAFAFLLLQSGYFGIGILMSSVAIDGGLGVASQSVLFAGTCLFATFITFNLMKTFTFKTLMILGMILYIPYFAAVFKISWYTLIPGAILIGFGTGIYFPVTGAYVSQLAQLCNEEHEKKAREVSTSIFFGVFTIGNQFSHVLGSLLPYFILNKTDKPDNNNNETNSSVCSSCCGVHFHDKLAISGHTNIVHPDAVLLNTLTGVFIAITAVAAVIVLVFVDNVPNQFKQEKNGVCFHVLEPLKLLRDPRMVFLVPFTFFGGQQVAFTMSDFSKAYISCAFGIKMIGLVMTGYGLSSSLSCLILGILRKWVPRPITFTFCCALHFALFIILWNYDPSGDGLVPVILLAMGLGTCDAFWQSQTRVLYGTLFFENKEAAFSLASTVGSIGHMTSFAYSSSLGTTTKLWILTVLLVLSYLGYIATELIHKRHQTANLETK